MVISSILVFFFLEVGERSIEKLFYVLMRVFLCVFNRYELSTYCMLCIMLGVENTGEEDVFFVFMEFSDWGFLSFDVTWRRGF